MTSMFIYRVKITCSVDCVALTYGLFDLIRKEASACGFPDVGYTQAKVKLEVSGPLMDADDVKRLENRLDDLALGVEIEVEKRDLGVSS